MFRPPLYVRIFSTLQLLQVLPRAPVILPGQEPLPLIQPEAAALSCQLMLLLYPHPEAAALSCQLMLLLYPHPEAAVMN
jgi:hypothetical protein